MKYLTSYQGASEFASAKQQAVNVIIEAVANPKVFQFDPYMDLDAVQALKGDGSHGRVYELLVLFASKDLEDFNKFYSANSSYVDSLGESRSNS